MWVVLPSFNFSTLTDYLKPLFPAPVTIVIFLQAHAVPCKVHSKTQFPLIAVFVLDCFTEFLNSKETDSIRIRFFNTEIKLPFVKRYQLFGQLPSGFLPLLVKKSGADRRDDDEDEYCQDEV